MKKISKYLSNCSNYQIMVLFSFIFLMFLITFGTIVYFCKNISAERLDFLGEIIGSLIGLTGIMLTISYTSHNTEIQLSRERKNNFDSAIAVENYKQYMRFSILSFNCYNKMVELKELINNHAKNNEFDEITDDLECATAIYDEFSNGANYFMINQSYLDKENKTDGLKEFNNKIDEITEEYKKINKSISNNKIGMNEKVDHFVVGINALTNMYNETSGTIAVLANNLIE